MIKIKPFFSVVTVVLNNLSGLKNTKSSLMNQDYKDFEWIVIDGGSFEPIASYLDGLEEESVKWISEKDSGIYDAMNKSLKLCNGNYIIFLNAGDCFSNPSILYRVSVKLKNLINSPDILFSGATYVFNNGIRWYRKPKLIEKYIWHGLPAIHQATFYKRKIFQHIKYDLSYKFCGDYYLASVLFIKGANPIYLDFSVVDFMVGGVSYCNPIRITIEPFKIQKYVLSLPLKIRIKSMIKRIYSLIGMYLLSATIFRLIKLSDQIN
jgi:putative colanic acid biosynthesis glycosyltransferase